MLVKSVICLITLLLAIQLNEASKQNKIFDSNYGMMEAIPDSRMVLLFIFLNSKWIRTKLKKNRTDNCIDRIYFSCSVLFFDSLVFSYCNYSNIKLKEKLIIRNLKKVI